MFKASLIKKLKDKIKISIKMRFIVLNIRPEAEWSNHEQAEN